MKPAIASREGRFTRIVVGTDFSTAASHAVIRACMLAAEHAASLVIVHAVPRSATARADGPSPFDEHLREARARHVAVDLRVAGGSPAAALAREAGRVAADLIVIGRRSERALRDALLGTTTERVLRRWRGDTLIVGRTPHRPYESILACVSLAPTSASILAAAAALSPTAPVHVLHAYGVPRESELLADHTNLDRLTKQRAAARRHAAEGLTQLLAGCPTGHARVLTSHVDRGEAASAIRGAALRFDADVVVVGKNRSRLDGWLLGSVTAEIVRASHADVFVLDPRRGQRSVAAASAEPA